MSRGAYHSAEIEFVFQMLPSKKLPWSAEDTKLSAMMSAYWANFAKNGDPNGKGLPRWPAYASPDFPVMHLVAVPHAEPDQSRDRYTFFETVQPTGK